MQCFVFAGSLKLDEICMQLNFELRENLSRKSNFPEVWKTKNKHNKRRRVCQCSVEERGGTQLSALPVLGQFHDDVSSSGEDDEGHSQHGAANRHLFYISAGKHGKFSSH